MSAIFYVLRTGCQWNALPRSLGASRHRYMTDSTNGERLVFSSKCGSMDWLCTIKKLGSIGNGRLWMVLLQKHLLGEKSTGPNPTDRAKSGTKRSILVDGKGVPLGVCVDGANRHDMKMTKATLQSIVIYRPDPTIRSSSTCAWTKALGSTLCSSSSNSDVHNASYSSYESLSSV